MDVKRMRVPDFAARKRQGEKIVMLTAYDATMARLLDRAGVDALLVGDSLGTVILGLDTTLPVTLDAVVHHTRAVSRGAERAFVSMCGRSASKRERGLRPSAGVDQAPRKTVQNPSNDGCQTSPSTC
jgi:ketopantoate hydroxymethyltransferase